MTLEQLMKYFKYIFYALVVFGISTAKAGSYDDFFSPMLNDDASAVTSLLQRGFDPNTRDPKGQPGLMMALQEQSPKVAKVLLGHPGIEIDALNEAGESALMMAALRGKLPTVQLLLDRGARLNQPGWSALHYAATGPEPKIVQLLLDRGADIDATSPNGTTPLMMAAQYGSEAGVQLLLERGADVNKRNQRQLGAVDFAKLSGREPLVRRLEQARR
jgi:ankyrin repeat protein